MNRCLRIIGFSLQRLVVNESVGSSYRNPTRDDVLTWASTGPPSGTNAIIRNRGHEPSVIPSPHTIASHRPSPAGTIGCSHGREPVERIPPCDRQPPSQSRRDDRLSPRA